MQTDEIELKPPTCTKDNDYTDKYAKYEQSLKAIHEELKGYVDQQLEATISRISKSIDARQSTT